MIRAPLLSLAILAILLHSCQGNDPDKVAEVVEELSPDLEQGTDITMIYSENGQVEMRLKAPSMLRHSEPEAFIEFDKGLEVEFLNSRLQVVSTLSAKYGTRTEKTEITLIRDSVVVVNERGERLNTEELIWDPKQEKIYSEAFVRIRTEDEVLYGTGFEADQEFSRYRIFDPEGIIKVEEDEQVSPDN
jgi:LPS export ABC transporter protein LptC